MALDVVLTTMKELILDAPSLPPTKEERLAWFSERYPKLTREETEDLARVEPKGWATYTSSIFFGEGSLLFKTFPVTMSVLRARWSEVIGKPFRRDSAPRLLHAAHPWASTTTLGLGDSYIAAFGDCFAGFARAVPGLDELARFELQVAALRKAAGTPRPKTPGDYRETLATLTVDELLSLECELLEPRTLVRSEFDVVTVQAEYFSTPVDDRTAPIEIPNTETFAVIGRDDEYIPCSVRLEGTAFELFSKENARIVLSDLAMQVAESRGELDEQALFARFLELVLQLRAACVLRFPFEIARGHD